MKKFTIILFFITFLVWNVSAGDENKFFRLTIPETSVVPNSLYNKIELLENRDTYQYAEMIVDPSSLQSQLNVLMQRLTDETAKDGLLFFQLRSLTLEKDKQKNDYSHIRFSLYEKINSTYFFIHTVDIKIPVEKMKEYPEIISSAISNALSENLTLNYTDPRALSIEDVENIDLLEKENLKAYNTNMYVDGIYITFMDFVNQSPDTRQITPKFKKDELKEIKIIDNITNKRRKIYPDQIFAVVIDGRPYIATDKKYIAMFMHEDELCFEEEISNNRVGFAPSFSIGVGSGGYRGGGIGLDIFTHSKKEKVIFKMDHLNGDFIPMSVSH